MAVIPFHGMFRAVSVGQSEREFRVSRTQIIAHQSLFSGQKPEDSLFYGASQVKQAQYFRCKRQALYLLKELGGSRIVYQSSGFEFRLDRFTFRNNFFPSVV